MKRVSAVFCLLLWPLLLASPSGADFARGIAAYDAGDYATAFLEFRAAADQGDAVAQYNLGVMYNVGKGILRDDVKAAFWFSRAAEGGSTLGQNALGAMYMEGRGVSQDYAIALRLYRLAADRGLAEAQSNLANLYFHGDGIPQSDQEAAHWYRRAARQGNSYAQTRLGYMYGDGRGVPINDALAYKWSSLAAAQGEAQARLNLRALENRMSRGQITEAQRLAAAFQPEPETSGVQVQTPPSSVYSAPPSTPAATVRQIQSHLQGLGYDPGPIDGMMGQRTSRAIEAFQRDRGIEPDGVASTTLEAMLSGLMGDSTQQPIPRQ